MCEIAYRFSRPARSAALAPLLRFYRERQDRAYEEARTQSPMYIRSLVEEEAGSKAKAPSDGK